MNSKEDVRGTSIGYAINLIMDYGNGRQVTIAGTLPLGADLPAINEELDKLRLATNRQQSFVTLRDIENTVTMAKKSVAALETTLAEYEREVEKEIQRLGEGPKAGHTTVKAQADNLRQQALNYKLTKSDEIARNRSDVEKGEALMAKLKKELEG